MWNNLLLFNSRVLQHNNFQVSIFINSSEIRYPILYKMYASPVKNRRWLWTIAANNYPTLLLVTGKLRLQNVFQYPLSLPKFMIWLLVFRFLSLLTTLAIKPDGERDKAPSGGTYFIHWHVLPMVSRRWFFSTFPALAFI